jgi:hypothetical protein
MKHFGTGGGVIAVAVAVIAGAMVTTAPVGGQGARQNVLIRTSQPDAVEAAVTGAGGRVTHRFRKIAAVAAEIPASGLAQVRTAVPAGAISKDETVDAPAAVGDRLGRGSASADDDLGLQTEGAEALAGQQIVELAQAGPAAYTINNGITRVNALHGANLLGQGMVVGVIDSGIRPGFPHLEIGGNSVVGCEDFVLDALGCSNIGNNGHGTFVSGMISANVIFTFGETSALLAGVRAHAPGALLPGTTNRIPMIGSAPSAGIYALRVFGATGGAPTSRILQAMERAIDLREQFEAGTGGADIQVVNMSLGGSTIYAGRDLFDTMLNRLLEADIVPVIAASNNGPARLTTGSPGSAFSALTVGASNMSHNERVLRTLQLAVNPAIGLANAPAFAALYRATTHHQTADFSSRGPNADGRADPDILATGYANYGQGTGGTTGTITLGSGTSYASPSVAGIATLLRQAVPSATATQVRNAIIATGNPNVLGDGSTEFDQGRGMVDAAAALALLQSGTVSNSLEKPHNPKKKVEKNLEKFGGLTVHSGNVALNSGLLRPGQQNAVLYNVAPGTAQVVINIANFLQTGPGNALFGDDIILAVHSAKTSAIGASGDYPIFTFTTGGTFTINNPEPGIMRVTLFGDWTNTDTVAVDATITSIVNPLPPNSASGNLREGQSDTFVTNVPAGTARLEFNLRWQEDWSRYPGADLDLVLVNPSGTAIFTAATLNSPERVVITNPPAGNWTVIVDGFEVHLNKANYKLSLIRDGALVKLK